MSINEITALFMLLGIMQFKHFLADFPLQTTYMLRKSEPGWEFLLPLTLHSAVHAIFTLVLVLFINPSLWWIFLLDFIAHFFMDRMKSGPRYLGQFDDDTSHSYWIVFGVDQMFHHLTNYMVIFFIVTTPHSHLFGLPLYLLK